MSSSVTGPFILIKDSPLALEAIKYAWENIQISGYPCKNTHDCVIGNHDAIKHDSLEIEYS